MKNNYLSVPKILYFILLLATLTVSAQTQIGADIDGETANDHSGNSICLSADGTVVAIGAWFNSENGLYSGHVRVFKNITGVWSQIGSDINGEAADDGCGVSVSLSADGTTLAVGATGNDGNGSGSGNVRVFKNTAGIWTQIGTNINGEAAGDRSGYSVSLSADGTTVAIGADNNDGNGNDSGHVRVYKNNGGIWTQIGADINGEAAYNGFGWSVSLSADGTTVAAGAHLNNGNGSYSGHVRVYKNTVGTWNQIGADINGEAANDSSGWSISLSADGTVVAIGAPGNDGNGDYSGHVRVYKNTAGTWVQIGADIDGEAAGDQSGNNVSLSSDGTVVAIAAGGNDGNGTNSGHVRVYKNTAGTWTQMGVDINGEAAGDGPGNSAKAGTNVSLSSNGATVAMGASMNDGNGTDSGHVRVYGLSVLSSDSFVLAGFSVYPNPVKNELHIGLQNGLQLQEVNIYSALGQLLKTGKTNTINMSDFTKGFYWIQIVTEKGKATRKIMVQ